MFTVSRVAENRIDVVLDGKINAEQMRCALDELMGESEDIENGLMLYDIVEFHVPSLEAMMIEFSRLPALFGLVRKFSKAAVISDEQWIQKISEFKGFLIPSLQIKAFGRNQREDAERWLAF